MKQRNKVRIKVWSVRVCVLLTSIVFIGIGITRSEHLEVWQKAVKICLECIGIG